MLKIRVAKLEGQMEDLNKEIREIREILIKIDTTLNFTHEEIKEKKVQSWDLTKLIITGVVSLITGTITGAIGGGIVIHLLFK